MQNRGNQIHGLVPVECSGKENPADIPSRRMMPLELSASKCGVMDLSG